MRRGFTLIELMVVIGIIAILAGILFPVFAGARKKAFNAQCTNNLRQLALAIRQYAADNDGWFPPQATTNQDTGRPRRWVNALMPYMGSDAVVTCPFNPTGADVGSRPEPAAPLPETSYYYCAYSFAGHRDYEVRSPSSVIMLMDGWYLPAEGGAQGLNYPLYWSPWATPQRLADWVNKLPSEQVGPQELAAMHCHNGGLNAAYFDSHVKWLTRATANDFALRNEG